MIALYPLTALIMAAPPVLPQEHTPGRTATALVIVAAVLSAAIITETIRYRRRRRVHRPIPLPPRRVPTPVVIIERSTRDLARPAELVAHRS